MRTKRLFMSTAIGLLMIVAFAAPASGASPTTAASKSTSASAPVEASAGGPIDLQIWPGQAGKTAIITVVEVDAKTKLPVTVRIPVVPGSTIEWAGEILGGPASSDIEQPFKLVQGQGGQFAEFTLTKSRRGQIDAIGFPLKVTSDTISVSVDYVQSVSSPLTSMSVRIPANVSKVKITPKPSGDPVENADGESLYALSPKAYKPGEKQTVTVSYSTVPPVGAAPGSELNLVLIVLGAAVAVAVVVVIVLIRRQGGVGQATEEYAEDPSESEETASSSEGDEPSGDDEPDLDFD